MNAIEIKNLWVIAKAHFWSRPIKILNGINIEVEQGKIFGFLGPNGAGKTTTIKTLLGLWRAQKGSIKVFEKDITKADVRRRIGFMPERAYFPEFLTGRELVMKHSLLAGHSLKKARTISEETLQIVGLQNHQNKRLGSYSKGMLQRVGLAQAIVGDPDLIVLDEPMSGLDPIGRRDIRSIIVGLQQRGKTVFFSTHILPDVEMICDKVAILAAGKVRKIGPLEQLLGDSVSKIEIVAEGCNPNIIESIKKYTIKSLVHDHTHSILSQSFESANKILDILRSNNITIQSMQAHQPSLEDLFVSETNVSNQKATK